MSELVSVIIAAYRAEAFIERPVISVMAQSYPHWEIVIASDDRQDYQKILHGKGISDSRIRFTATGDVGTGESHARNTALQHARGNIVSILDADDAFMPEKLERLLPVVLQHGAATSDISIVNSASLQTYSSLAKLFGRKLLSPYEYILANLHTYSLLTWDRRKVALKWDENVFVPDLILGLSAYNSLDGIYYDPDPLHVYYKHASSITNHVFTAETTLQNYRLLLQKALRNDLTVTDDAAKNALARFLELFIPLEEKFFSQPQGDPVMGWYDFLAQHRETLYSAL